jgi:hypothetical protein
MKKMYSLFLPAILIGSLVVPAFAAAPDGQGPWADTVVSSNQGLTRDGNPVPAARSNPSAALGVAENDTVDTHFFSLGFGGVITLGFDNGISSGTYVVEATNQGYPNETAKVEVSEDGNNWFLAGNVTQDGTVSLPKEVSCGKFVRITDTSNKRDFSDGTADAYDVDGVRAEGDNCTTAGRMTGGGSVFTKGGVRVTHGFELHCLPSDTPNNLEINWDKGNKFKLDTLTYALCTDNPAISPNNPAAGFDTYHGKGTGKYNGTPGYSAEWVFTDAGEPGKNDIARIVIKDPANNVVLAVSGNLNNGNQQAH